MKRIIFLISLVSLIIGCSNDGPVGHESDDYVYVTLELPSGYPRAWVYADYQLVSELDATYITRDTIWVPDECSLRARIIAGGNVYNKTAVASEGLHWILTRY